MKQFVLPPEDEHAEEVRLTGRDFHYLCVVRRYRVGDSLPARSAAGVPLTLEITKVGDRECLCRLYPRQERATRHVAGSGARAGASVPEAGGFVRGEPRITLYQATLKGKKLDQVIRQVTEAGVARIVPVVTDHCVADPLGSGRTEKKVARWRAIVKEAVQQSGRPELPKVEEPRELNGVIGPIPGPEASQSGKLGIFFHESGVEAGTLHETLLRDGGVPEEVSIIIGPEGGLSGEEVAKLRRAGWVPGYLGPQVLRSETAALYAVAAVQTVVREVNAWVLREQRAAQ